MREVGRQTELWALKIIRQLYQSNHCQTTIREKVFRSYFLEIYVKSCFSPIELLWCLTCNEWDDVRVSVGRHVQKQLIDKTSHDSAHSSRDKCHYKTHIFGHLSLKPATQTKRRKPTGLQTSVTLVSEDDPATKTSMLRKDRVIFEGGAVTSYWSDLFGTFKITTKIVVYAQLYTKGTDTLLRDDAEKWKTQTWFIHEHLALFAWEPFPSCFRVLQIVCFTLAFITRACCVRQVCPFMVNDGWRRTLISPDTHTFAAFKSVFSPQRLSCVRRTKPAKLKNKSINTCQNWQIIINISLQKLKLKYFIF